MNYDLDFILEFCKEKDKYNILNYIEKENNSFPISMSSRVNLEEFVNKIFKFGKVYVLKKNDIIVGLIAFYANDYINRRAYLTYICVNKENRDKKFGLKLMNKMYDECKACGMKKIRLSTNINNVIAQKFYEKIGYKKTKQVDEILEYEIDIL